MTSGTAWLFDDSPIPDPHGEGQRAVDFLRLLKHPKSRRPDRGFQLDQWQERLVRRIYGPTDENGERLVRSVFLQVGKGSRKTSLAAGLALLHVFGPRRTPRGESLVAAASKDQASIAFNEAVSIVETVPQLARVARIINSKDRKIIHPRSGAWLEAISSDGATNHGRTPNGIAIVDELWAHARTDLWHSVRTGVTKAPGSLLIVATTAGRGTTSPDFPILEYARRVQSGEIIDPHFLPVVFEADPKARWDDEALWHDVLPGLRHGYPDLPSLRQLAAEARERPADRAAFQQFYLGIRQETSLSPFVDMMIFDEGESTIDFTAFEGRPCHVAVDASKNHDLSAVVAVFGDEDEGFTALAMAFCPEADLAGRSDRDTAPYSQWRDEGWLTATPGTAIQYSAIVNYIRELSRRFDVREISFDPAYGQPIMDPLLEDGFPVVTLQQGYKTQSPALNTLERAIIMRKLKWDSPALRWCVGNVAIHSDSNGNRTMHKGKSKDRIDLATALWMATSRQAANGNVRSIFDDVSDVSRFVWT